MKFKGSPGFSHRSSEKIGVLLVNLGTPEEPTPSALRRYLAQFLSDPRVVEIPKIIWMLILHGIILRIRPAKSAHAYESVWTERGSPLKYHTEDQTNALREALSQKWGDQIVVDFAMRYGQPSISSVIDKMAEADARKLLVLPLYPQYSGSTTGSVFDAVADDFKARRWLPDLRFVSSYHTHSLYIDAMASQIKKHWENHERADKLLFSFHGVPKLFLLNGDPYHCQCHATARLLAERLGLSSEEYCVTFQSRFGKAEWLKPYTDATLKAFPSEGVKSVQVFCPGFSSDCLETLEEIAVENREYFEEAGGERYEYIAALNSTGAHIEALESLVEENIVGWSTASAEDLGQRQSRYEKLKEAIN